jgi:hypothetical protein
VRNKKPLNFLFLGVLKEGFNDVIKTIIAKVEIKRR